MVEDILRDLGLLRSGRASELVEVTVEPLVDLLVEGVVVVTDLLGGLALLAGFGLRGGSVLVGTTNIDDVVSSEAGEASVDISRQDTSDNVAKMGHVVDVGQSTRDQDVSLAFDGKDGTSGHVASDLCVG